MANVAVVLLILACAFANDWLVDQLRKRKAKRKAANKPRVIK